MDSKNMLKVYNTYIHIPFCQKKCNYCDFTSFANSESNVERYLEYLEKEIKIYKKNYNLTEKQKTIYFGGGTPSLLSGKQLKKILSQFNFNEKTEITIEVNPKTVDEKKLREYKELGINRLSIGIQSFNDFHLRKLGRIHSSLEAIETYKKARKLGFDNISLDLMFSLPNQTLQEVEKDLLKLFSLNPEHFSIYSLIWEEGTNFYRDLLVGKLKETDNELEAEMYEKIIEEALQNGYEHYEISNFSKKNFESKHNINYWENKNYLGLGLSAAGYLENVRYNNYSNFSEYYDFLDNLKKPLDYKEILNSEEIEQYEYLVGFRLLKKPIYTNDKNREKFEGLEREKYLRRVEDAYFLTRKGLMFFNDFISNFI